MMLDTIRPIHTYSINDKMAATATATAGPGPSTTAQSALLLPGQPLPSNLTRDPKPFLGAGCYESGGKVLSSVVGRPRRDGSVSLELRSFGYGNDVERSLTSRSSALLGKAIWVKHPISDLS